MMSGFVRRDPISDAADHTLGVGEVHAQCKLQASLSAMIRLLSLVMSNMVCVCGGYGCIFHVVDWNPNS